MASFMVCRSLVGCRVHDFILRGTTIEEVVFASHRHERHDALDETIDTIRAQFGTRQSSLAGVSIGLRYLLVKTLPPLWCKDE